MRSGQRKSDKEQQEDRNMLERQKSSFLVEEDDNQWARRSVRAYVANKHRFQLL